MDNLTWTNRLASMGRRKFLLQKFPTECGEKSGATVVTSLVRRVYCKVTAFSPNSVVVSVLSNSLVLADMFVCIPMCVWQLHQVPQTMLKNGFFFFKPKYVCVGQVSGDTPQALSSFELFVYLTSQQTQASNKIKLYLPIYVHCSVIKSLLHSKHLTANILKMQNSQHYPIMEL